jgi:hypothetical protein
MGPALIVIQWLKLNPATGYLDIPEAIRAGGFLLADIQKIIFVGNKKARLQIYSMTTSVSLPSAFISVWQTLRYWK